MFSSKQKDGTICEILNIVQADKYECNVIKKVNMEPFYNKPIPSNILGIFYVGNQARLAKKILPLESVERKLFMLPFKQGRVFFPLLHMLEGCKMH